MVLYGYRFTHLRQIHTNSRVWLAEKLLEEPALTTCAVAEASQWTDAFAFRLLRCVPPHRWFWNPGMPQLSPSSSTESWKRFPLGGTSSPARKGKWKAWIVSLSHEAALAWYHACVEMWHLWTCGIHYVNDHAWKQIEQNIRLRYCDIKRYQKDTSMHIHMNLYSYVEIFGRPASPWALTMIIGLSPWPATHLKGHSLISACTMGSANLRPIKRLASKTSKSLEVSRMTAKTGKKHNKRQIQVL